MNVKKVVEKINVFIDLWDLEQANEEIDMIIYKEDIEALKLAIDILHKLVDGSYIVNDDYIVNCPNCECSFPIGRG